MLCDIEKSLHGRTVPIAGGSSGAHMGKRHANRCRHRGTARVCQCFCFPVSSVSVQSRAAASFPRFSRTQDDSQPDPGDKVICHIRFRFHGSRRKVDRCDAGAHETAIMRTTRKTIPCSIPSVDVPAYPIIPPVGKGCTLGSERTKGVPVNYGLSTGHRRVTMVPLTWYLVPVVLAIFRQLSGVLKALDGNPCPVLNRLEAEAGLMMTV
ncbi:hypothetical protein ZHAS_00012501 [Anopheles sinensis]|uniref:Uncharacterized protein n=1 Tax=Anopheles sinensis TaxID=74873 RepID=A0A084W324_ANOSI|nr:hypothetical protein ZHAS_00012501 [Anopheles sinensis]